MSHSRTSCSSFIHYHTTRTPQGSYMESGVRDNACHGKGGSWPYGTDNRHKHGRRESRDESKK
jgi:hypothetical protein